MAEQLLASALLLLVGMILYRDMLQLLTSQDSEQSGALLSSWMSSCLGWAILARIYKVYDDEQQNEKKRRGAGIDSKLCSWCGKESKFRCSRCKVEWYCSKSCQEASWVEVHKKKCKDFDQVVQQRSFLVEQGRAFLEQVKDRVKQ